MHDKPKRRIAVADGGLAGLEFAVAAASGGADVEVFESGPRTRMRHMYWDTTTHVGDEKVRFWTSDGWSAGGGLSERLGGRSLCYHGILIGLEPTALASWDTVWDNRLSGEEGLYASILNSLCADFPELVAKERNPQLEALGLRHVPQAVRLDDGGRFEAYSPLVRALELEATGRIRITRGRVQAVMPESGGYVVEVERSSGTEWCRDFDNCVLASSAIGNVQILASSLRRDITTVVTDHFCVGAFIRLPPGTPLTPFRHAMLESGFVETPKTGMNIFFSERPQLPCGDRIVQIQAVIEQPGSLSDYSVLKVEMRSDGVHSDICANVSEADRSLIDAARVEIRRWAERLAAGKITEIVRDVSSRSSTVHGKHADIEAPWYDHDEALKAVTVTAAAGVFSQYEVPYGAFEHEACTHPIGNCGTLPVSNDLEVVELSGVHVVGPGSFPRLGAANPALTIIALSRWLGNRLGSR